MPAQQKQKISLIGIQHQGLTCENQKYAGRYLVCGGQIT